MPAWSVALQTTWPQGRAGALLKTYKLTRYLEFVQADASRSQVATSAPPR